MQQFNCIALVAAIAIASGGCATHYVTPSAGVSMVEFTDEDMQSFYERQPVSPFPANIAILRVQDAGYATRTSHGYGQGRYTVVTTRDIESDEALDKVRNLPLVAGVAPVGRILLPPAANTLKDLREPAARLRADMLMIYSVDTTFTVDGRSLGPLSMISLGLIPNKKAHVTTTVAGALVDVRSGFIYGTAEATAREEQHATVWSTELAIEASRLWAEKQAFESFVDEFQGLWSDVLDVHAATRLPAPASIQEPDSYYRVRFDHRSRLYNRKRGGRIGDSCVDRSLQRCDIQATFGLHRRGNGSR